MREATMSLIVRELTLPETELIIDYFHGASQEHLETMGVDPTRLPTRDAWRERFVRDFALPIEQRQAFQTIWLDEGRAIGFSTTDKIVYGERANMHLHIVDPDRRNSGAGAPCVRQSVDIYFETLRLKRLFCEPNAFNVAPNRTLQKAGFKYLKTHMTVPGLLNYHQAVTQWVVER
jgi:RimJ/RimL family protein N-acetyltransferase